MSRRRTKAEAERRQEVGEKKLLPEPKAERLRRRVVCDEA